MVIRRSVEELCQADHEGDPAILEHWLANKTPKQVRAWIEAEPAGGFVGVGPAGIAGVGSLLPSGRIALNYVAPWARRQGVSTGLMRAMEQRAVEAGHTVCTLTSTITAHAFYLTYGYQDTGEPVRSFGGKPAFPMRRLVAPGS
ncbi:GNAT family N-acetyltransferase [Teichococcus wenyumeiae]|nr:GNAT family N-acetyltransferase [Pseudoroseomonas wenyumeiae]